MNSRPGHALGSAPLTAPAATERDRLSQGWELAGTAPGQCTDPSTLDRLDWGPAQVPGTVAAALRDAGSSDWDADDLDAYDWWFRTRLEADSPAEGEELVLGLDGIATVAEVFLDGEKILQSDSMFAAHELTLDRTPGELAICCRALAPLLAVRRRPRARWRTKLVAEGNLRFYRTMLLGRAPGFAPGPAVVGPWRGVWLLPRRGIVLEELRLRPRVEGEQGILTVRARLRALPGTPAPQQVTLALSGPTGEHLVSLELSGQGLQRTAAGELRVPDAELWWPCTHGPATLYRAELRLDGGTHATVLDAGRVGFRRLDCGPEPARDGIQLRVNDVPVFARGAVWTPADLALPDRSREQLRSTLETVVGGGMNMLRVPGTGCYENRAFYDLCDELGLLVWQDFMFANLDYPEDDSAFMLAVEREAAAVMGELAGRPSLAVLCGSSEVAQQVAMLGLDSRLAAGPLFGELLPRIVREAAVDAPYLPSTPWGGDVPFRTNTGVANYYGVGAYLRPLEDARRAEVRFAAECLAFSNVPDEEALEPLTATARLAAHHPLWKAGVPRDAGAGWDFEDVRDHYLARVFDVDPVRLRSIDPERYLELSRTLSGEVMAEVFGEWRREASPTGGGLVLWLGDLRPGAGWGLLDHRGVPKVAYHHLRRALAPVAVWSTDEGLGGVAVHVANDRPAPLLARLRVSLYRDLELLVDAADKELKLPAHSGCSLGVEELLGRFVDASWAYRFGPPVQDLIVISLEREEDGNTALLSQAFRLPAGRPRQRESAERLGLEARLSLIDERSARLTVSSRRLAYGVRAKIPGYVAEDDAFCVEPGHQRVLLLRRLGAAPTPAGVLTALNLAGRPKIIQEPGS